MTCAASNELDVMSVDILNAYLQAPSSEKHYIIICLREFGLKNVGKRAIIKRALYGGKPSGSDFWRHLRSCKDFLGNTSCPTDPIIWMKQAQKDDGIQYWQYILLHVDDVLVISHQPKKVILQEIGKYFVIKPGSLGTPKIYFDNKVPKVTMDNSVEAWAFSSS